MKKGKLKKEFIIYPLVVLLAALLLWGGHQLTTGGRPVFGMLSAAEGEVYQARVGTVVVRQEIPYTLGEKQIIDYDIHFYAKVLHGERKGETILTRQIINSLATIPVKPVAEGDRIMLSYSRYDGEGKIWVFQEYDRSPTILVLLLVFLGIMLLLGGKKGIGAILSLTFTCLCIFYFFIPAILTGWNVYGLTVFCCTFVISVTLILVNGLNFKSFSAAVGCVGGLLVAGVLFSVSDFFLQLTGMIDEESGYLILLNESNPINLKAIIFASVLIGVLGAVLDVGVSIAASLNEVYRDRNDFTLRDVMTSGMNIGRDIISTMTNTIILAYIGGALSLTILLIAYSNSFLELLNREIIIVEVLQALLGSIGLLFTIPLTTLFYALALVRSRAKAAGVAKEQENAIPATPSEKLTTISRLQEGAEGKAGLDKPAILALTKALGWPADQYWVTAGAAMVLHGVKQSTGDVDLGCTNELFCKLAETYPVDESKANRILSVSPQIEVIENWPADEVVFMEGIPVVDLGTVIRQKKALGRPKDLRDIAKIEAFQREQQAAKPLQK